jgi:hypothetical protein
VFIGSTELCQKIKDKVLSELFDYEYEANSLDLLYKKKFLKEDYNLIERLELINLIISQRLKELKEKDKLNEIKKIKENRRLNYYSKNQIKSKLVLFNNLI